MATNSELQRSNVNVFRAYRWVKGGNIEHVRALSHSHFTSLIVLDDTRLRLNKAYPKLGLRAAGVIGLGEIEKNVKQFCGELLDRCTPNHWKTTLRVKHACLKTRVSVASSLFSIRKLITSKKPDPILYAKNMSVPQPEPSTEFLDFCSEELEKQFREGWDRAYWSNVCTFVPPTKSNRDKKECGTYREFATSGKASRGDFLAWADGKNKEEIDLYCRPTAVLTGGKWRCITLADRKLSHLLPVHNTIYGHLTKKRWLLRGEACPQSFDEFGRKSGEIYVSGDYEGATDNLNIRVTAHVLRIILSRAFHIPQTVKDECLRSLNMRFVDSAGQFVGLQQRGQLMGNPLSFPLLCLINFLSFKFSVKREVPVKINGDDIVFRARPAEVETWFDNVAKSGLVVSKGKTLVSSRFFSLNSSYFLASDSGASVIPHFRASNFKKCQDVVALTGRVAQIKRDLTESGLRLIALRELLRKNMHVIYPAQGSFSRRYFCQLPVRVLRDMRLLSRESFYLGLPFEPAAPKSYVGWRQNVFPAGWVRKEKCFRGDRIVDDNELGRTLVSAAWVERVIVESKDEYWARVRDQSFRFVEFRPVTFKMYAKFAKTSFRPTPFQYRQTKGKRWVEERVGGSEEPVDFRLGGILNKR